MASVRSDQGLTMCQTEVVPTSSKMDLPLAKVEPISKAGDASVKAYFRKGKTLSGRQEWAGENEKKINIMCEKQPCRHQLQRSWWGRSAPGNGVEILLQPMEETVVEQVLLAASGEEHGGADVHTAACGGPYAGEGGYALKEAAVCGEEPTQKQIFLTGNRTCGGPMLEKVFFLKDCTLWRWNPHWSRGEVCGGRSSRDEPGKKGVGGSYFIQTTQRKTKKCHKATMH
ncbi:hypothetical protein llap_21751 [Limosa lapponica baueri]|uniref:Uncharacterized protein n=1 Tax=Limosa lapponica baueri TaxID=1758121 RepID=A0A2I0T2C2_LIMLA|nr:hypothetical protein llap_21751 [Limosa lapponica baueri]